MALKALSVGFVCVSKRNWVGDTTDLILPNQPSHEAWCFSHTLQLMQKHRDITVWRLDRFLDKGQWREVMLASALEKKRLRFDGKHVELSVYSVPKGRRISFDEAVSNEFRPTKVGEY